MAAAHRLQKCDKGRLFSQEQTLQARRQIEQLKAELESHQQSAAENQAVAAPRGPARGGARAPPSAPPAADVGMMPLVSAHGFADTQILPD